MTMLLASVASFSDPFNVAFADSHKQEKEEKMKEKLEEKQQKVKEKLAEKEEKIKEKLAEKEEKIKEKLAGIKEFDDDVIVTSSSITSSKKTILCHVPPGNPAKAHTIAVGNAAVPAHLAHGDYLGSCDGQSAITDVASFIKEKQQRKLEKLAEKENKALERAEKLLEKLEQKIAKLEQRLQKLMEMVESGEYYGNVSNEDSSTTTYSISFAGVATSLFDESVTDSVSGNVFIENMVTTSDVTKFKVTGGEIIVGNNIHDVIFGKAREMSDSGNSMVLILQTLDAAGNENTIRLTLNLDSEIGSGVTGFEIKDSSKISGEWYLTGSGQVSL